MEGIGKDGDAADALPPLPPPLTQSDSGGLLSTPTPMDSRDQQAPDTVYQDAHSNITTSPAEPPESASVEPTDTAGTPGTAVPASSPLSSLKRDHYAHDAEMDTDFTNRTSHVSASSSSSSVTRNTTGLNQLMKIFDIIDSGGLDEPKTEGIVALIGQEDSGKSSLINSIACPDGKGRLVPVGVGSCTNCLIRVELLRSKGRNMPVATVELPGRITTSNDELSIKEAHDKIKRFMDEFEGPADSIGIITIKLTSPHVPTITLVDTSGLLIDELSSFEAINHLLTASNEPVSCLFCVSPPTRNNRHQRADNVALKEIGVMFHKKGLEFSKDNVFVGKSYVQFALCICY